MKKELDKFFAAVMFFTRLPVPKRIHHNKPAFKSSLKFFPWIGIIVGSVAACSYILSLKLFSPSIAIFISMISSIFLTGAFHEDGFADVCDGFGGGWTKEKILLIMKDSRLGTYGVIGLISIFCLKFLLLLQLQLDVSSWSFAFLLVSAHSVSRFTALTLVQQLKYVTDKNSSKSEDVAASRLSPIELLFSLTAVLLSIAFIDSWLWISLIPVLLSRVYLGYYFKKWIQGYTGDCLGATQQITEIIFYAGVVAVWKFI